MHTTPPPLPPRQHHLNELEQDPLNDEPPPAYTPSPAHHTPVLQIGPRYPFGPTQSTPTAPHPSPYNTNHNHPHPQPGIQNYPLHHQHHPQSSSPSHPPQQQSHWQHPSPSSHPQNSNPFPVSTEPTSRPTPGRPLLFEDRILVYPYVNGVCYFCPKCCNTGFKGFDATRPCRKCWLKYGKPWQVVRMSPMTNASMANLQRPLPPVGAISYHPPPLVVQPGDPRIGGRLCLNCNGSGSKQEEINLFNVFLGGGGSEVCSSCRGTGRIF